MSDNKVLAKNLIFEVTSRCNCNCMYCYNVWKNKLEYPRGELSTRKLTGLLKKVVQETKAGLVTLTGGEPLLRKDLERITKSLRSWGVEVNIITNATLLSEERIKKFISLGVANFEVPLLSGRREIHNRLMRFDSFDLVTRAIVKIKKYGGKAVTVFVATQENIGDFEDTAKLAFALGSDGIMFNRFNPGGEGANHIKELLPSNHQVSEALKIADMVSEKYRIGIACSIPIQPCIVDTAGFKNLSFGFCSAGTENAYYAVDPIGNLRMCNHSPRILGNLFKQSFHDLISQEAVKDFIASMPPFCFPCEKKNTCLGGCKAAAEACFGSPSQEDPFLGDVPQGDRFMANK